MKIPKISKMVENYRYNKHQQELNRLVKIEDTSETVREELYSAREILANYAKAKKISMEFSNTLNQLLVLVSDRTGKFAEKLISADTTKVSTVERERECLLENSDGVNYIGHGVESHEDTFLRSVYRTVEELTYALTKK
ncbi:MAG: hypothetical protein NC408_02540 [Candidatus Gastranaerophilales bacterium]|nr:hypothetical protein [Candidatus Gastranaerophilales bacterium]MCM1072535.1 hypothetical protein [Bacteroides sp.]